MQIEHLQLLHTYFPTKIEKKHIKLTLNLDKKLSGYLKKKQARLNAVILIQSHFRGFLVRKKLRQPKDQITFDMILQQLWDYNQYTNHGLEINKKLVGKHKLIRKTNFPSHISENIIKYYLLQKFGIMADWGYSKPGDLSILSKRVEVKAGQCGPTSFGPHETWDYLYFINCEGHLDEYFLIYSINLKSTNPNFYNLQISKGQTYKDQCLQGRRPRINFSDLQKQLGDKHCQLVFKGRLEELRPKYG